MSIGVVDILDVDVFGGAAEQSNSLILMRVQAALV
jgi:hypothetical protein